MSASDVQRAPIFYPQGTQAVVPTEVDQNKCDHEANICYCVHDWRITWGNVPRKPRSQVRYIE